jgi:quercetin dioxygenase-like cupin family protein
MRYSPTEVPGARSAGTDVPPRLVTTGADRSRAGDERTVEMPLTFRPRVIVAGAALLWLAPTLHAGAQNTDTFAGCIPVSERAGLSYGCFILTANPVGPLDPETAFWHVESFPTRAAAERAKGPRAAVVEAFNKVWLLTIAKSGWKTPGATHVAEIGPLPVQAGTAYTAQFMEAAFSPGMKTRVHRHSGPEAWYTLSGETCLETPQGAMTGRAGGSNVIVPGGPPMELTATGTQTRRSLVLILHDSSQPATTLTSDWVPKGLCKG